MIAGLLLCVGCASTDVAVVCEFELDPCSDGLFVPVSCCGDTYLFIVDTGASVCVFDLSLRECLGYPVGQDYAATHSGVEMVDMYRAPQASVGSRALDRDELVVCDDLLRLQVSYERDIRGVLGMSFMEDLALELDPDERVARFLSSPVPDTVIGAQKLRLDLEPHGTPELHVTVGDTTEWVPTVDTGCSYSGAMHYELCEELLDAGSLRKMGTSETSTPYHSVTTEIVLLDTLRFGAFSHCGVGLARSEASVLGMPVLMAYHSVLDFPERAAYIGRRESAGMGCHGNTVGVSVYRSRGEFIVGAVDPDGPAAAAGVVPGDVVLEINGRWVGGDDLMCVDERLRVAGSDTLSLALARGNERMTVSVVRPDDGDARHRQQLSVKRLKQASASSDGRARAAGVAPPGL